MARAHGARPPSGGAGPVANRSSCRSRRSSTPVRARDPPGDQSTLDARPAAAPGGAPSNHAAVVFYRIRTCVRCRYRSTEVLWQCPHCHEWNPSSKNHHAGDRHRVGDPGRPRAVMSRRAGAMRVAKVALRAASPQASYCLVGLLRPASRRSMPTRPRDAVAPISGPG